MASISADLAPWSSGGYGKLRYADDNSALTASRVFVDYHGRVGDSWTVRAIADYIDDESGGADLTEAYAQWRPVPKSRNQHQLRIGAFYPAMSLENTDPGWGSPYTISFSAINTWLGEEIRPIGAEWSMRRRIGAPNSPHQLRFFAAGFYGNDPAATLLFWRGWSLHDRQTRLNDKLQMPPFPAFGRPAPDPQTVEPIAELDSRPGYFAGVDWSFAQRLRVTMSRYDNRADINAFRDSQWGWRTKFDSFGLQYDLPGQFGLIAQWMGGDTLWIAGARPDGNIFGPGPAVLDYFDSHFVLLTKSWQNRHRVSLRSDRFSVTRPGSSSIAVADDGDALTLAYRFTGMSRLTVAAEWLQIDSARDYWSNWNGLPREQRERQFILRMSYKLNH